MAVTVAIELKATAINAEVNYNAGAQSSVVGLGVMQGEYHWHKHRRAAYVAISLRQQI
jgi:hypothetical protein